MITEDMLILVDEQDNEIGYGPKMEVHLKGTLHRAFSILLFNPKGEMLLQQRAHVKYHSPGLWTNTCCSHPLKGEELEITLQRRLNHEMGLQATLDPIFQFQYQAHFENGLIEHELDHVYVGITEKQPVPNPEEVEAFAWKTINDIKEEVQEEPEKFTPWFRILMNDYIDHFQAYLSQYSIQ